jgi:hypothetical protein
MAGRCMSASHLALGGVRVQRPMCATGQAVGTAAAIATRRQLRPSDIKGIYLAELQQRLLRDGCYLVGVRNEDPADLALKAEVSAPEVTNGWNRESRGLPPGAQWSPSNPVSLAWEDVQSISEVHLSANHLRFTARISVEMETPSGWRTLAERNLPGNTINRRQVLSFPTVKTRKIRIRLHDSNRDLRLCEVRVYQ